MRFVGVCLLCIRFHLEDMPPLPPEWPAVRGAEEMPCVLWLYVPKETRQ